MASKIQDVIIIGGGPGGLSTALGLARQLYSAVVFDSSVYRNERASHMHNVLTWDHRSPEEYRAAARSDLLTRYNTIRIENVAVNEVRRTDTGIFEAKDANGKVWQGRKLVLATGVRDIAPEIDGYADCWGLGIFHCLFCHGFEERGVASVGLLAIGDCAAKGPAMHLSRMANRLAKSVTVYTDGAIELSQALTEPLQAAGFELNTKRIVKLAKEPHGTEVTVHLEDGSTKTEGFLVHKPKSEANGPFAQHLSLELTEEGDIRVKPPFYESTSVPGVFAAGDCGSFGKAVSQAAATGLWCASGLVAQLLVE
ncbi:thioredoxin reductase glit [Phaeosphaeriaceae sp. PMI808]|nr:thioredoxin reductase glit [Phaeosphaeriaceae sp. PMI808]